MNENSPQVQDDNMLPEYDFSGGIRGKYVHRFAAPTATPTVVELSPDVAAVFPDAASVNEALRTLLRIARSNPPKIPV